MVIWLEASNAQNSITAVYAEGSTVCVFDTTLELFMQPLDDIRSTRRFPLAFRQPGEGEEPLASFSQAVRYGTAFQSPFAQKSIALGYDLLAVLASVVSV